MTGAEPQLGELGAFLRAGRERVSPGEIGLASTGRRRTPGLRREEVAQLAGVGITWYTWLEQGRASGVSEQVIGAVARVLRMTEAERHHALVLSGHAPVKQAPPMRLLPSQAAVLEKLLPFPAAVQTDGYEIVASNRAYRFLFDDLDAYDPDDRNCAWLMFTEAAWRGALVDESQVLPDIAARLRAHRAEHRDEPRWEKLIDRLLERSDDFRRLWEHHEVADERTRLRRYRSPRAGALNVDFQSLWLDQRSGARIIVMSPADRATEERLERLSHLVASAPAWTARDGIVGELAS